MIGDVGLRVRAEAPKDGEQADVISLPWRSPGGGFELISLHDLNLCSVVRLAEGRQSSGILSFLERTYGPNHTTRWSTLTRITHLAHEATAQPD